MHQECKSSNLGQKINYGLLGAQNLQQEWPCSALSQSISYRKVKEAFQKLIKDSSTIINQNCKVTCYFVFSPGAGHLKMDREDRDKSTSATGRGKTTLYTL